MSLLKSSCEKRGFSGRSAPHTSNNPAVWLAAPAPASEPLTDLPRCGAHRLMAAAVSAEFEEHPAGLVHEMRPPGRQWVIRNGHIPEREALTGLGEVDVRVSKACSRSVSPEPFRSSEVPPHVRRRASLDAAIPWLYLRGCPPGRYVSRSPRRWARRRLADCRQTWSIGASAARTRSTAGGAAAGATTTSAPRPPPARPRTATSGSRSRTSPPRMGRTFELPTSSNRPSQPSATEAREPEAGSPDTPCSR